MRLCCCQKSRASPSQTLVACANLPEILPVAADADVDVDAEVVADAVVHGFESEADTVEVVVGRQMRKDRVEHNDRFVGKGGLRLTKEDRMRVRAVKARQSMRSD